jgi:hypothetical protein
MTVDAWAIVATVALFGGAHIGALIFLLGGQRQWLKSLAEKAEKNEEEHNTFRADISSLKVEQATTKGLLEARL